MTLGIDDRLDRIRRRLIALSRKHLVRGSELEQRRLVGADRNRQVGLKVLVDTHLVRRFNNRRGTKLVADVRGRHVERLVQRLHDGHLRLIGALVVRGSPSVERHRLVGQHRGERERRRERCAIGIERREIDDRLERRPGLALGVRRAIKLTLGVVAPADKRANRASLRVQRDHRGLQPAVSLRAAQSLMILLERRDIVGHRVNRVGLKFGVERRVNLESLEITVEAGDFGYERSHVIGEIRRAPQPRRLGDLNRRRDRGGVGRVVDHAGLLHHAEHDVAPLAAIIGMSARVIQRRRLDHSDQHRRLGRRHLGQVLVEKISRRLRHPVDRRAFVLAHRHVVDVAFENFIFAEPNFEHRGDRQLFELAAEAALATLHERPRELLRERAGALGQAMRSKIGNRSLDDSNRIDSRMVIEKTIFVGQQSLRQVRLQLAKLDLDPLGRRARKEASDHFRLEHRLGLGDAERIGNARDSRALQAHPHHLGRVLLRTDLERSQVNRNRIFRASIFAGGIGRRHRRIAQLRQPIQQPAAIEVVAGANRERRRENRGGQGGATLLDQRGNLAVQLGEVKSHREERQQKSARGEISHAPSANSPLGWFLFRRIRFCWLPPAAAHQKYCLIYKVSCDWKCDPSQPPKHS